MPENQRNSVEVRVVTTSGSCPKNGYDRTPIHQPIKVVLQQAAKKLEITDTSGWIARVGEVEIDPSKNYADYGLSGQVLIDYGPKEGAGGHA